jgi:hypothetical protein
MRLAFALLLTPLLAACGSSEPPGVEFERPVGSVYSTLAIVDGRIDMAGLLKSSAVSRTLETNNSLVFRLGADSEANRGTLTFRFEPIDAKRSRVIVDAEIPEVEATIGGQRKFLSEAKIEGVLARQLRAIAKRLKSGATPLTELEELDQAIAFTALALDPKALNEALSLAGDSGALAAAMERELAWSSDGVDEWDAADAAMDTNDGQDAYGDAAAGSDTAGAETFGDEAMGTDPEADSDYGVGSE